MRENSRCNTDEERGSRNKPVVVILMMRYNMLLADRRRCHMIKIYGSESHRICFHEVGYVSLADMFGNRSC